MQKPQLFESRRDCLLIFGGLILLLALRLGVSYGEYRAFIAKPFYYTYATLLTSYQKQKDHHTYRVLKLRSEEGLVFYTTTYRPDINGSLRLRLQLFPSASIGFGDYLGVFYVKSRIKAVYPLEPSVRERLHAQLLTQHTAEPIGGLYSAIFLATPLPHALRKVIAQLGVSHLVALSGFHLGILWGVIYGGLLLLYRPLQQHYFPYRYALLDMGMVTLLVLGGYLWFVGSPPSLIRAYAMLVVGWGLLLLGVELVSVRLLVSVVLLLLVLLPSLLVSLGFWLSVAGVFYIFVILHHTQGYPTLLISLLLIPWGIFLLMLPIVHMIFGITTPLQLLSPLLSLLFIPFYPLSLLLHLLGYGGILDGGVMWLLSLAQGGEMVVIPWWGGGLYGLLSLGAIGSKRIFGMTLGVAGGFLLYLLA